MSFKVNVRNRKLKRKLIWIVNFLMLKKLNNSWIQKIILFSVFIVFFWLFMPWIDTLYDSSSFNSFSFKLWITWYFMFWLTFFIFLVNVDKNLSSKFKIILRLSIDDFVLTFFLFLIIFFLTLNALFVVKWMAFLKDWIIPWKWIIFSFVWSVLGLISTIFWLKQKTNCLVSVNGNSELNFENQELKNNEKAMKLPF